MKVLFSIVCVAVAALLGYIAEPSLRRDLDRFLEVPTAETKDPAPVAKTEPAPVTPKPKPTPVMVKDPTPEPAPAPDIAPTPEP